MRSCCQYARPFPFAPLRAAFLFPWAFLDPRRLSFSLFCLHAHGTRKLSILKPSIHDVQAFHLLNLRRRSLSSDSTSSGSDYKNLQFLETFVYILILAAATVTLNDQGLGILCIIARCNYFRSEEFRYQRKKVFCLEPQCGFRINSVKYQ